MSATPACELTHVDLVFSPKKSLHEICFGKFVKEKIFTKHSRLVSFSPDTVFCLRRIAIRDGKPIANRIDIIRAICRDEPYQKIPFIRPGGDLLLCVERAESVSFVENLILTIEKTGINPADISANYWRHIHNRLYVKMTPRNYTKAQHKAARLRARVTK